MSNLTNSQIGITLMSYIACIIFACQSCSGDCGGVLPVLGAVPHAETNDNIDS